MKTNEKKLKKQIEGVLLHPAWATRLDNMAHLVERATDGGPEEK